MPARSASRRTRPAAANELTSLDERLGLLLLVRIGLVVLVLLSALFASGEVGFNIADVGPISAVYVTIAAAAEWYRRRHPRGRLLLHRAILPLDAVYLVIVTTPSGGPRSPLVVLFAVQLIAVTLLVSERAGIRMALWDTFLFIFVPTLSLSGRIGSMLGVHQVAVPPAAQTALAIMGFWVVALCTAFFSSVSERELRRSRSEMTALADMAQELEEVDREDDILSILLRTLVEAFPFQRGALWFSKGERPIGFSLPGVGQAVVGVPVSLAARGDAVARTVWADRQPTLVRTLDPESSPVAAAMLPGATNVVVLPLEVDGGDSGVILLEYGGHPMLARVPRRTLVMLAQFANHAALTLRNARLLAERERLATMDGLTGLANRREFDRVLAAEINRAERSGEPASLVVFDVDHFKAVNDTRGHLAGDEVLRSIAGVMAGAVREMDLVARYGGEEFAVVLPRCDQDDAVRVVERITVSMSEDTGLQGVTLSSGIATVPFNASGELELVGAADQALYESKRNGRNRYTVSDNRPAPASPAAG
jgi:diguanylate cyclase (GGDEF)-like protein